MTYSCQFLQKQSYTIDCHLVRAYKIAWIEDIDDCLKEWPYLSHEIAEAITFNPNGADVLVQCQMDTGHKK